MLIQNCTIELFSNICFADKSYLRSINTLCNLSFSSGIHETFTKTGFLTTNDKFSFISWNYLCNSVIILEMWHRNTVCKVAGISLFRLETLQNMDVFLLSIFRCLKSHWLYQCIPVTFFLFLATFCWEY